MKVGDLIEANKGEFGVILDIELMYPRNPCSPPRSVKVHWLGSTPHWHRKGLYAHVSGIKRIINESR